MLLKARSKGEGIQLKKVDMTKVEKKVEVHEAVAQLLANRKLISGNSDSEDDDDSDDSDSDFDF